LVFLVAVVLALDVNRFRTDGIPLVVDWSTEARLKAATDHGMEPFKGPDLPAGRGIPDVSAVDDTQIGSTANKAIRRGTG